jgi:hypothetical protein
VWSVEIKGRTADFALAALGQRTNAGAWKRIKLAASLWRSGVPTSTNDDWASLLRRVCFWLISLLLAILSFSLLVGGAMGSVVFVFRITMIFAFPAWCLYLPFIFFLRDADGRRSAMLLLTGILIGPAALIVWDLSHLLMGEDLFQGFWNGDPEAGMGAGYDMIFASVVGFLTSAIYVLFLKFVHPKHTAAKGI